MHFDFRISDLWFTTYRHLSLGPTGDGTHLCVVPATNHPIYSGEPRETYTAIHDFDTIRQHYAIAKSNEVSRASIVFFDDHGNLISTCHLLSLEYSTSRPSEPTASIPYVLDYSPILRSKWGEMFIDGCTVWATVQSRRRCRTTTYVPRLCETQSSSPSTR